MKKNILKKLSPAFKKSVIVLSFCAIVISCTKSDADTNTDNNTGTKLGTISSQVGSNTSFSILNAALIKANLTSTLDGAGPFTVFAPTDDAFAAIGYDVAMVNTLNVDKLKVGLLYHVLGANVMSADVPAGPNAKVITASGDSIFVTKNSSGVFINGIKVVTPDILASNGVVHTLSKVLMPPTGNIVQVAAEDTSFTFLVAAVLKASTGSTDVATILSSGIFTLFAPTNNAFRAAGFSSIEDINAVNADALTTILKYHVVFGRIFSSDFTVSNLSNNSIQPFTLTGSKFTITISSNGTPNIKGNQNLTTANLIRSNIMATNGVVHVVDQVLLD